MHIESAQSICLGRVPSVFFDRPTFSNVSELIFDKDLYSLLRLCGVDEQLIGEGASDYDRFNAYCNAVPVLYGHPIVIKIVSLLKSCFDIDLPCSAQNCNEIWRIVADKLIDTPMIGWDLINLINPTSINCVLIDRDQFVKIDAFPKGIEPVLCGQTLVQTNASDWSEWEKEMSDVIEQCILKGSHAVYFKLSDELLSDIPSLYHVEQSLCTPKKRLENIGVLLTQALRYLCLKCRQKGLFLYTEIQTDDLKRVVLLLERIYNSVGLPSMLFFSRELKTMDAMIEFSARLPMGLLRGGFMTSYYPSERELSYAFEATIARYPSGALTVLYGDDLRYTAFEKARFEKMVIN